MGRNISRKGDSKSTSELSDICNALNALSLKQSMPTFLATSTMVLQAPQTNVNEEMAKICSLQLKLDSIESSMANFFKAHQESSSKSHDKLMSKHDLSHKRIDDLKVFIADKAGEDRRQCSHDDKNVGAQLNAGFQGKFTSVMQRQPAQVMDSSLKPSNAFPRDQSRPGAKKSVSWASVVNGRQSTNKSNGESVDKTNSHSVFVVKGMPLDISEVNVAEFLRENGISVSECKLLTSYDQAQTLTFRIAVCDEADHVKITTPGLWSPDIVIEPFRKRKRRSNLSRQRRTTRQNEVRGANGITNKRIW